MNSPLVSVIITTFNGNKERLSTSLDSVLSQTYKNIEIIIVNDASTNNIEESLKEYSSKYKNIIYLNNEQNLGCGKSSNKGIKHSKGKYIARIDDDDIWNDKTKLEKQVKFMEENSDYGLCGVEKIIVINEEGKKLDIRVNRISDDDIRQHILQSNQFTHSSILFRREALEKIGFYNEKYRVALDYEIICKIGASYKFINLKGITVSYRINTKGITKKRYSLQYKNAWKTFLKNRNNYPNFYKALILRIGEFIMPKKFTQYLIKIFNKNINNKFIYQKMVGGLGNQMFQYAFIKALAKKRGVEFELDKECFHYYFRPYELENFNINNSYLTPFYKKWGVMGNSVFLKILYYIFCIQRYFMGYYQEKRIDKEFLMEFPHKHYFCGYWASYKFFEKYNKEIRKDFMPKKLSNKNIEIINKYKNKNTISVHIRRGDYLKPKIGGIKKLWDSNYYINAINYMKNNVNNPIFLFFSDDMNWVKNKFKGENYVYIDINKGKDNRQDLILMSNCKHNIIANSTFSWWGAYLNDNDKKIIIGPKNYSDNEFVNKNIYPESWIRF